LEQARALFCDGLAKARRRFAKRDASLSRGSKASAMSQAKRSARQNAEGTALVGRARGRAAIPGRELRPTQDKRSLPFCADMSFPNELFS
jgi:hypothetical protein